MLPGTTFLSDPGSGIELYAMTLTISKRECIGFKARLMGYRENRGGIQSSAEKDNRFFLFMHSVWSWQ